MSEAALGVRGLRKSFRGVCAVNDVSFDVPHGSLTALIGPNGAGKTTLFNLITNLYPADAGEVLFYGTPLAGLRSDRIASLGLVRTFQTARTFPAMTALENVLVGAHLHVASHPLSQMFWTGRARREGARLAAEGEALLELVGLLRFRDAAATDLPMGAQKLLEVIRALMARPRILLLDEPAAGLNDTETAELASLLSAVRTIGVTVVVVEHNMSLVMSVADQVVVLDAGALVVCGPPDEIRKDRRVIEAYVGKTEEAA